MANVKNKSIAERSSRRKRYINAIDPLREMYKCTAAQVHGFVMSDLKSLQQQVENEKKRIKELEGELIDLMNENTTLKEKKNEISDFNSALSRANETSSNQVLRLQAQLEAREQRLQRQDRQIELLTKENMEFAIRCGESS